MNRKRKRLIVGALIAVELLICVAIVAGLATFRFVFPRVRFLYVADTRAEEIVEQSFVTDGPAALDLTNTFGDIDITGGEGDRFVVKATKEAWGQDKRDAEAKVQALQVNMTMDGGTLRVQVEDPGAETIVGFGSVRGSQVRFVVTAPARTAVVVNTRHGRVTLTGTAGGADLTSRFGLIAVEDVSGDITVDTNNGDVTVRRSGDEGAAVELHSDFGDITAQEVTAGELALDSNNGALELEDVTVHNDLILDTRFGRIELGGVRAKSLKVMGQNGDITLQDARFDGLLDISTTFGAVSVSDTEASEYKIETQNGAIELDGGGGPLWLHSNFGDVDVRGARDATLDLVTGNGKVMFEGSLSAQADHLVKSNFGAVLLRLPPDTAVFLDADTDFGRIRCDFDVLVKGKDDRESRASGDELHGTINGGRDRLRIETRNGDITIEVERSR